MNKVEENRAAQYLVFQLGENSFGVDILRVKEILQFAGCTTVPRTPDYIRGVVNLRGNVLPVVDLLCLFQGTPADATRKSCVIIVEIQIQGDRAEAGILVDSVEQVLDMAPDMIEPAPNFGSGVPTNFISGMARFENRFVILLDLDLVLAPEEMRTFSPRSNG